MSKRDKVLVTSRVFADDKRWLDEMAARSGFLSPSSLIRHAVRFFRREVEAGKFVIVDFSEADLIVEAGDGED